MYVPIYYGYAWQYSIFLWVLHVFSVFFFIFFCNRWLLCVQEPSILFALCKQLQKCEVESQIRQIFHFLNMEQIATNIFVASSVGRKPELEEKM